MTARYAKGVNSTVDDGAIVCVTGGVTHTLTSEGADASEDGTGRGTPIMSDGIGVRRLTPLECERLMGAPDRHTEFGIDDKGKLVKQSDAQRYRQVGNSIAIPVFEEIAWRLVEVDSRY